MVDANGHQNVGNRLTKKEQKKSIAQQFLMDDQDKAFSKRKYEGLNDKRRRMGIKKSDITKNKGRKTKQIQKGKAVAKAATKKK